MGLPVGYLHWGALRIAIWQTMTTITHYEYLLMATNRLSELHRKTAACYSNHPLTICLLVLRVTAYLVLDPLLHKQESWTDSVSLTRSGQSQRFQLQLWHLLAIIDQSLKANQTISSSSKTTYKICKCGHIIFACLTKVPVIVKNNITSSEMPRNAWCLDYRSIYLGLDIWPILCNLLASTLAAALHHLGPTGYNVPPSVISDPLRHSPNTKHTTKYTQSTFFMSVISSHWEESSKLSLKKKTCRTKRRNFIQIWQITRTFK